MSRSHIALTTRSLSPLAAATTTTTTPTISKKQTRARVGRGKGGTEAWRADGQGYRIAYITPRGARCAPSGCRVGTPLILSADTGCSVRFGQEVRVSEGEGVEDRGMVKMNNERSDARRKDEARCKES